MGQPLPIIDWNDQAIEFLPTDHRTPRFIAWFQGMIGGSNAWLNKNFYNFIYGDLVSNFFVNTLQYRVSDTVVTYNGVFISTLNNNIRNNPDIGAEIYDNTFTYLAGYVTIFQDNFYQCLVDIPVAEDFNPNKWQLVGDNAWYKIAPSYIGAKERSEFNSSKLIMESALNKWFRTTFKQPTSLNDGTTSGKWYLPTSDIWIQTKSVTISSFISYTTANLSSVSFTTDSSNTASYTTIISASDTTYEFIVWIPTALSVSLGLSYTQIVSSVVDKMSLLGTKYTVQIY